MTDHPIPFPIPLLRGFVEEVVDGDTYKIRCDLAFRATITVPIRIRGVDAPERSTEEGKAVRDLVRGILEGQPVLLKPYKDRQSFARWIGDVQFLQKDMWWDLADWLVMNGAAVRV